MTITRLSDVEIANHFEEVSMDFQDVLRIVRWLAAKCDEQVAGEEVADRMLDALGRVKDVVNEGRVKDVVNEAIERPIA
ncbi:MAG: hypothetical protein E5Y88_11540 [Mesorhizobium sp.]|uniref:hypothetical protein n=1 Tax=Mesorhizobium sp. TaxID=1871066 RepID=UPI0012202D31|nr:hypothetical protein [Mesorhizobium sp.]TIL25585.1 MAG: hypothetical protein E5Y88_11540 [Mesorhizobium sp.]